MITHVAIRYNGIVWILPPPNRHHDVIRLIGGMSGPDVQGFLTHKGKFLNRAEAYEYALKHDQIINRAPGSYNGTSLYSEDLW